MDTIQPPTSGSNQGSKKALLEKLMSNLLGKPGRSMHEIVNGVKEAISAYRNYAKEWDTLNGTTAPTGGVPQGSGAAPVGDKNSIQTILDQIKQQKSGSVPMNTMPNIPPALPKTPMMPMPQMKPAMPAQAAPQPPVPPQGQPQEPIAGQPQTSTFNRPAPVSNLGIHGF